MDGPLFVKRPDLAILMARYISHFAKTELLISAAFSRLIGDSGKVTRAIFHHIRNISDRIEVLKDLAGLYDTEMSKQIGLLIERIQLANKRRNILAHGIWLTGDDGSHSILTNAVDKKRKQTDTPVDETILGEWLTELLDLNQAMTAIGFEFAGPEHALNYRA